MFFLSKLVYGTKFAKYKDREATLSEQASKREMKYWDYWGWGSPVFKL